MGFSTVPCNEFVEVLASKAPVPGGGGASALVGAIGTALGNMVGSLTVGKKKYADVEAVSYTHLLIPQEYRTCEERPESSSRGFRQINIIKGCLLYTSRCV